MVDKAFQDAFNKMKPSTDKLLSDFLYSEGQFKPADDHKAPKEVRSSPLGCVNCLWASCECSFGSKYKPCKKVSYGRKKVATCEGYTYYD